MDKGRHCTSAQYSHLCVAEREIAEACVRSNLMSTAEPVLVWILPSVGWGAVAALDHILVPHQQLNTASSCLSDHLGQCGLWMKLPGPVVCGLKGGDADVKDRREGWSEQEGPTVVVWWCWDGLLSPG